MERTSHAIQEQAGSDVQGEPAQVRVSSNDPAMNQHMAKTDFKSIDEYIATFEGKHAAGLRAIRKAILSGAPGRRSRQLPDSGIQISRLDLLHVCTQGTLLFVWTGRVMSGLFVVFMLGVIELFGTLLYVVQLVAAQFESPCAVADCQPLGLRRRSHGLSL
jgi:hypothetical protein